MSAPLGIEHGVWHACERFQALLDPLLEVESTDFFNRPDLKWLHDACTATAFARLSGACKVRLPDDRWPDFEVEFPNGSRLPCECTMALFPGREIGREYREWQRSGYRHRHVDQRALDARRAALPASLQAVVNKKVSKNYARGAAALVIYENVGAYLWRDDDIEPELVEHTRAAFGPFRSVWVLSHGKLYRTWPRSSPDDASTLPRPAA